MAAAAHCLDAPPCAPHQPASVEFRTRRFGCTVTYSCAGAVACVEPSPLPTPFVATVPAAAVPPVRVRNEPGALLSADVARALGITPPHFTTWQSVALEESLAHSCLVVLRLLLGPPPTPAAWVTWADRLLAALVVIYDETEHDLDLDEWERLCQQLPEYTDAEHVEPADCPPGTRERLDCYGERAKWHWPLAQPGDANVLGEHVGFAVVTVGQQYKRRAVVAQDGGGFAKLPYTLVMIDNGGGEIVLSDADAPVVRQRGGARTLAMMRPVEREQRREQERRRKKARKKGKARASEGEG